MPEIPELEAIAGFFAEHLPGHEITRAETRIPHVFRSPASEFRDTLAGDAFTGVRRHGKFLLFDLASARTLAINPMLTGRFQFVPPKTKLPAKTCLVVDLEDSPQFRYADARVMGKLYLLPSDGLEAIPGWTDNGPDLLDPELTEDAWVARIKKYRGQVKNILTNAAFVQGIGNAYSDEILWEARINPATTRTALSEDQLRELYRAAHAVMDWATPLVRDAMVKDGTLDYEERRDFMRVHRRGGEACPRCGATISEIAPNQRVTSYCRQCQPGGYAGE
ncbi:MAG: DNA-formamidopyrimidine glycosylase family protein [Dehalococcoidia bacterium]|nr:DNA-formamidopyrimidine glycosylase family protein [Dehalococcoidia bacterium]